MEKHGIEGDGPHPPLSEGSGGETGADPSK